jgi:hypothetical protein
MTLAGLALLVVIGVQELPAAAPTSPHYVVPNSPDLTIRVRSQGAHSPEVNVTVRLKGPRQVRERSTTLPGGSVSSIATVGQCDRRRTVLLSRENKTYGYVPIELPSAGSMTALGTVVTSVHSAASGGPEEVVIDAVDTGERRQFASLTARHVVTTTTSTVSGVGAGLPRVTTHVRDGWYVDLPAVNCIEPVSDLSYRVVSGSLGGSASPIAHVTQRGRARTGMALIETERWIRPEDTFTRTTELVELSTAPLDAALFDVPADYRAALPLWGGGFTLEYPDTIGNRLSLLWGSLRDLASRWWP